MGFQTHCRNVNAAAATTDNSEKVSPPSKHSTNSRHVHPTTNPLASLWADRVPPTWRPFVQLSRIDMLAGPLLMFWPCAWGILSSAYHARIKPGTVALELIGYFVGSVILHSAACTWNDVCDRKLDAQVERTKHRPLAAGTMTVPAALIFLIPQVITVIGLLLLTSQEAFRFAMLGLFIWQPVYPFMKRITFWPQAWLGFVMNWGLLVAWIDNTGVTEAKFLSVFFFGSWCWTMHYDSTYAMQDKADDVKAGIKSTAILFGTSARPILSLFCVGLISALTYVGICNHHGPAYFVLTVLGGGVHLVWQLLTIDLDDPKSCFARFDENGRHLGFIVACGMAIDYLLEICL